MSSRPTYFVEVLFFTGDETNPYVLNVSDNEPNIYIRYLVYWGLSELQLNYDYE